MRPARANLGSARRLSARTLRGHRCSTFATNASALRGLGVVDWRNRADAEQVTKEFDCLLRTAIAAQNVEEIRQGVPRDVHLVGFSFALFQCPLASVEQTGTAQGNIKDHVRTQQDMHEYFTCLPVR